MERMNAAPPIAVVAAPTVQKLSAAIKPGIMVAIEVIRPRVAQIFTLGSTKITDISVLWLTPIETTILFLYGWISLKYQ